MIRVEGVTHRFGDVTALNNVSFHVPKGSVFGFIGPNGAGKTTAIRMMATLLEPQEGFVSVGGFDCVNEPSKVRKVLGFMPDDFGVYERVTVHEYLSFFASAYGLEWQERTASLGAVMELTNLNELHDRPVSGLSKGMRQRLSIARTLLHDPKVLILDEPANGLDPRARVEMRHLIEQLRDLDKTILLSSHILTELSDMVDSVAILEQGRLVTSGSLDEINRKLRPDRVVKIRLLEYPEGYERVLTQLGEVQKVDRGADGHLRVAYEGGDEVVAAVVRALAGAGLAVVRVEPERDDLEHIFMEMTRGSVQ